MRKKWQSTGIYAFLEASGKLETGTPEELDALRKAYWKEQKRIWKKNKRKDGFSYTVLYSQSEHKTIIKQAKALGISRTRFIKQASLQQFSFPDIHTIRTLLANIYSALQSSKEMDAFSLLALRKISELEKEVMNLLIKPKPASNDR